MTKEEIIALKPGREMDILMAEKVMGWRKKYEHYMDGSIIRTIDSTSFGYFMPSTDIASAWEVVDKLKLTHSLWITSGLDDKWYVITIRCVENYTLVGQDLFPGCDTVMEAICKAALLKVEGLI